MTKDCVFGATMVCTWCLAVGLSNFATAQDDVLADPLSGPVIVLFNDAFGGLERQQFGVFRDEDSPRDQFIEERPMVFKIAGHDEPAGFLVLPYNVTAPGSFNGWWLRLGRANWSKYKKGELVLRLRRLDPATDKFERSVDLGMKDTRCATNLKVELKSIDDTGRIRAIGLRQRVREKQLAEQKEKGYFDLRIPLADFVLDLGSVYELVIVFENRAFLPTEYRGALGIRGIAIASEAGQKVDELLAKREG